MERSAHSIVVVSLGDPLELRHTINSIIRSVTSADLPINTSILILDETKTLKDLYIVDDYSLPVVHAPAKLSAILAPIVSIIPEGELITLGWIKGCTTVLVSSNNPIIVRPELCLRWGEKEPSIIRQPRTLNPIYTIDEPFYGSSTSMHKDTFLDATKKIQNVSASLATGEPWQQYACTIVLKTAVFSRNHLSPSLNGNIQTFKDVSAPQPFEVAPSTTYVVTDALRIISSLKNTGRSLVIKCLRTTHLQNFAKRFAPISQQRPTLLPNWLIKEWEQLHRIDNRTFPSQHLLGTLQIHNEPSQTSRVLAHGYFNLIQSLQKNKYEYVIFAPWLIRGGADKFTIEYANTISMLRPNTSVLLITTIATPSEWLGKLNPSIDHCNFGNLTRGLSEYHRHQLLRALLLTGSVRILHIINSELAYDFVANHKTWLKQRSIKVVATSFSQEVTGAGQVLGYSHTHMPKVYETTSYITTDNQTVADIWHKDYGFNMAKIRIHHLPFPLTGSFAHRQSADRNSFKILWASRLSPEKLPQLVPGIGKIIEGQNMTIDMYGSPSLGGDGAFLNDLPSNVQYLGPFDGMDTLPLHSYDAFLYTSLFDGMPNTLLEVGCMGLPIVTSAVGGIPELIEDGKTGLLVSSSEDPQAYAAALVKLRDNPKLRVQLSGDLQEKIRQTYSQEQFEKSIEGMLSDLEL